MSAFLLNFVFLNVSRGFTAGMKAPFLWVGHFTT